MLLTLLACAAPETSTTAPAAEATDALTWHQDARPIVERSCTGCHVKDAISGVDLSTYEDVVTWAPAIAEVVGNGTMPPWGADSACADYRDDLSLRDDEVTLLLDWIAAGTPEGDPDTAQTAEPWLPPTLDRVDLTVQMPAAYTPQLHPDDYRCFLIEWPYDTDMWVTGYDLQPGNTEIVHHIIPYIIQPEDVDAFIAMDEAEDGEGYTCYGGPGGSIETLASTRWLGAWAPGSGASMLPEGTGLKVEAGSLIAMQVHYYSTGDEGSDITSLDLRVEAEAQDWADIQPWTDISWVMGTGMEIPAGQEETTHAFSYTSSSTFQIHSISLHMHTLGTTGGMWIERADGSEDCLLDVPRYDFNWQRSYQLVEPLTVTPGDTVHLSCTWNNPTDSDVAWGDGTDDEMCLGVTTLTAP